jgi:hypothetical protein
VAFGGQPAVCGDMDTALGPEGQAARPIRPRILAKRLALLDIESLTV